ncbi:hypothetical protein ACJMK2_006622 [Sinanodonta woodiana]|uniref:Uncharacterized protein n=1 Tax=Sinanodonta woodiana TaxID=1069815 RepID=A0ABD3VWI3_SINWO
MKSGSYDIIIVLLFTTLTIASAAPYIYDQSSKYNSQGVNGVNQRNMMNLNNIPGVTKETRMPLGTGGMSSKILNRFSQGSSIGVNDLSSGFSGVQKGYRIRKISVKGGNTIDRGINHVQNRIGIRIGSQQGITNKMTERTSGGPQGTSFSNSYFSRGKPNTVPSMNAVGGGFSPIHNRFRSGVDFGNGRRTKMTEAMLGRPQGSSFGTSYLPSINGNHSPKISELGGDIHRVGNGHANGMGSGYGNIKKMAGGTPGGTQFTPSGRSFNENPLPTMNGLVEDIHSIGNGHVNEMVSGYGNIKKMAGGTPGGTQFTPSGRSFNENPLPTMNGLVEDIHSIGNGHVNEMVSGYGNIKKMAGGTPGGTQFTPSGRSFNENPLPTMNGLVEDIHSIGNGHVNEMVSGYGNIKKMAGGTPGGTQFTPSGRSFNENPLPTMNGHGGDIHHIGNWHVNGMGSGYGNINKMAGGTPGGARLTPFGKSFNENYLPTINGHGGDIHRIGNGHVNGMASGYGNINKMTGGTPGGTQLSSFSMAFNENPSSTMNGHGGDIHRIQNGHFNGMGSGYGNINTMAGETPGEAQLTPFGMSFVSSRNTNGLGGMIESAGSGATFGNNVGDNGDNMAIEEETRAGDFSSGNQEIGDMTSNDFSSNGNGNPWETNSVVPDNFDHYDDSEDTGSDYVDEFDDMYDQ